LRSLNPSPSFYKQFNGYTLGLLFAMLSMYALWLFGAKLVARVTLRKMDEAERASRIAKFNSTVLARALLVLYLVYPGARSRDRLAAASFASHAGSCSCSDLTRTFGRHPRRRVRRHLLHVQLHHAA
jgi:hypothetical protein